MKRMRGATATRDGGAILLLVLIIVTVVAAATAAVVEFGFDSPHAATAQSAHQRAVNALDDGLQAAIQNTSSGLPVPCNGTALTITDVDGPAGSTAAAPSPLPPIDVTATCTPPPAPGGSYQFLVTQSLTGDLCLSAQATFAGGVPPQSATVSKWTLGTLSSPTACEAQS
jgi:hypothetical protein